MYIRLMGNRMSAEQAVKKVFAPKHIRQHFKVEGGSDWGVGE